MTQDIQPMCLACSHLNRTADNRTCDAFPEGIPEEIWMNQHAIRAYDLNWLRFPRKSAKR